MITEDLFDPFHDSNFNEVDFPMADMECEHGRLPHEECAECSKRRRPSG